MPRVMLEILFTDSVPAAVTRCPLLVQALVGDAIPGRIIRHAQGCRLRRAARRQHCDRVSSGSQSGERIGAVEIRSESRRDSPVATLVNGDLRPVKGPIAGFGFAVGIRVVIDVAGNNALLVGPDPKSAMLIISAQLSEVHRKATPTRTRCTGPAARRPRPSKDTVSRTLPPSLGDNFLPRLPTLHNPYSPQNRQIVNDFP